LAKLQALGMKMPGAFYICHLLHLHFSRRRKLRRQAPLKTYLIALLDSHDSRNRQELERSFQNYLEDNRIFLMQVNCNTQTMFYCFGNLFSFSDSCN
jgi:hypothetical protein